MEQKCPLDLGLRNLGLVALVLLGIGSQITINIIVTDLDVVNDFRVESEGALGDEGRGDQDRGHNRVHDTSHVHERRADVTLVGRSIDHIAQDNSQDGVQDDVERVQEGHDSAQGRDLVVGAFNCSQGRLNVGSEGNITGSPTKRNGDPDGSEGPGVGESVFGDLGVGVREDPDDQEAESIETQPGQRGLDLPGKEEDKESAE